ncbi:MAG TPA: PRC-barrel domain-containing protein [Stellaceae bacterium]|jgi:sporulation protein YlmC with PRC-barrel domain|nr:PRC-barrel domain-containing protein [Stellaceae bacterium]
MRKTGISVAIVALMALTGPAALAQNLPQASRPMTATPAALTVQPDQMRASKLIGTSVYDVQNQDIGSVKDLVVSRSGQISAVVIDVGSFLGMGGKYVAVSMNDLKTDNNRLTLGRTKDQLKAAPAFQLEPNNNANSDKAGH